MGDREDSGVVDISESYEIECAHTDDEHNENDETKPDRQGKPTFLEEFVHTVNPASARQDAMSSAAGMVIRKVVPTPTSD